ncbi:hypothetical protein HMPREF9413_1684 [Paenibacillus sp. HGF7]|nr:hypothetical protein HMPREF9413_1684 [Paenibacillus sp. HGF7]
MEVWYQQPHYYRISLTNEKKDITQVVLRNDDGVFVLTPHLHKSFRFQSDWPENQGQVYLFQSLAQSILLDTERQFTKEGNSFVFDVAANYANSGQMARQKIWLDQKSLAPQKVEVSDSSSNVLVKLDFTQFEFGKKLEKDSFDMQRNMTSWDLKSLDKDAPVSGAVKEPIAGAASPDGKAAAAGTAPSTAGAAGKDAAAGAPASGASAGATADGGKAPAASPDKAADGSAKAPAAAAGTAATGAAGADKNAAANSSAGFGLIEPSYMPKGVAQQDIRDVKLGENTGIMVRYQGTYNYTLLELAPQTQTVSVLPGDIVDLGYTLGVVTGDEKKTLTWTYEGIEFRLATADLPHDELVKIAQSVAEEAGK